MDEKLNNLKSKNIKRIFTHTFPDMDAIASAWFVMRFIARGPVEIHFVPASWSGIEMIPGDIALDIQAGGQGIKGKQAKDGTMHSCFKSLVDNCAETDVRAALKPLVKFVDRNDAFGGISKIKDRAKNKGHHITSFIAFSLVLKAYRASLKQDSLVFERVVEFLDGLYKINYESRKENYDLRECVIPYGKVALITKHLNFSARNRIFKRGFKAIIYTDGNNLGILTNKIKVDSEEVLRVIASAGESSEWFIHSAGFMVSRGSKKDPKKTPSKVDPHKLALAVQKTLEDLEKKR